MQIQQLQKLKLLGQGTFGRCYLVRNRLTGQVSVLKQIQIMGMTSDQIEESFKQANILKSLDHPFIVGFQDSFESKDGHLNILMNYADGGDLAQKIKEYRQRGAMLGESEILDWFTQVCLAIRHVHRQKIIHRDIKAQNIFLTREGRVRLGDFGIARNLQRTLQKIKSVVGTPYYMSPEICQNKEYSFKTDIWSLGVLLLQMCLLKPPFDAQSIPALALKITKGEYVPVPKVYSKELRKLTSQIMQVDPTRRPSVEEILKNPLLSHRVDQFLPREYRERELSTTGLQDPKRIVASRGLFIECGGDESGNLQEVISPKNGVNQNKNHDLPVKRIDNYTKDSRGIDKNDKKTSKRGDQLRRRETSQPILTPKGHAKIENERKIMVKNSSMVSFEKKKPQNGGCFKKNRSKCSPDIVQQELMEIVVLKNDINSMKGQFSNRLNDVQIEELEESQNDQQPSSLQEISVESPLQTLEQLIRELTGVINLQKMYEECEGGICMSGPCSGLVTLGRAMRGRDISSTD